ncbi:unnamed protein product [Clavelina lepadiformis]|uniref:Uncharacterized protein n=1 Tax=Clavelina lepadiformis TaxID=159417 RepID=A0ABP0FH13_CLALP
MHAEELKEKEKLENEVKKNCKLPGTDVDSQGLRGCPPLDYTALRQLKEGINIKHEQHIEIESNLIIEEEEEEVFPEEKAQNKRRKRNRVTLFLTLRIVEKKAKARTKGGNCSYDRKIPDK